METHTKLSDEAANGDFLQHLVLGLGWGSTFAMGGALKS